MSVRVFWDSDEQKIIWYVVEGTWTWDEMYAAYYKGSELQKSVSHRFHAIIDMRRAVGIPPNTMLHVTNFSTIQVENLGIRAIVTTDTFVKSLFQIGAKFSSKLSQHFVMVQTVEQAYARIAEAQAEDSQTRSHGPLP
ncbi:MAG: hypothetical protein U0694_19685 [Anaerolineae bacterium]